MRILIANRGEIARRIMRTARRLGHETVAVYADPDADAPFTREADHAHRLGPADLASSYLSVDRLVAAIDATGADAVHPGYGFLAERADFATAVTAAGATWIGPHPDAIASMGSKIEARRLAASAGVPVIPGYDESQDVDDLAAAADRIGYPVLVKAASGGGGKGIRIVHDPDRFRVELAEASAEAERSFGDGAMIVERFIQRPRHVEVQVVGDRHGHVVHLGTRECSVQRRYQKLFEEAPAPNLPDATTSGLQHAAVRLAASIGYDSAGTVEFVVDDESGEFFFLEMNTRLQVEHPVTEAITGLDLVELMITVASGAPLPVAPGDVATHGHAIEVRVNAEDPARGFAPQTGTVSHLVVPDGVRWDAAIELGGAITPHYDPTIAKLVVHGPDRAAALRRLARGLDELVLGGLVTNTGFLRWLLDQPPVIAGRVTTRFVDEAELPGPTEPAAGPAAQAWARERAAERSRSSSPWSALQDFRITHHRPMRSVALGVPDGTLLEVGLELEEAAQAGGPHATAASVDLAARSVAVNVGGRTHTFSVPTRSERWAPAADVGHGEAGAIVAPFPAVVSSVEVSPGGAVAAGDPVVVLEAMKMLHTLSIAGAGTVDEVRVAPGDHVEAHQVLVTFEHHPHAADAEAEADEVGE